MLLVGVAPFVLGACLGGGGSSTKSPAVSGLSLPDTLAVVTATGGVGGGSTVTPGAGVNDFPANADYFTDGVNSYVYDPSMEALGTINMILCLIGQTAADEMVNEGAYTALIDEESCETDRSESSSGGSSAGSSTGAQGTQELNLWTVRSSRDSNGADQVVRIWVPNEEEEMSGLIYGKAAISKAPTGSRPFGEFKMDFAMKEDLESAPMFRGVLETTDAKSSALGFSFWENMGKGINQIHDPGDYSALSQVSVNMSRDQSTGVARVRRQERFNFGGGDQQTDNEYTVAFDPDNFLREEDGANTTHFHRDEFVHRVWSYTLYHADGADIGQRVDLNGGFPIRDANDNYGWIGYYGMWFQEGVTINDGDTVFQDSYERNGSTTQYTVRKSQGKLYHHTRETLTLAEIDLEFFRLWESDPITYESTEFNVQYNHGNGTFWKISEWDKNTGAWVDLPTPEAIALNPGDWLHLWSEGLGGSVTYIQGDTEISFLRNELVNRDDAIFGGGTEATLYGLVGCLASEITQNEAEQGDVYLADAGSINTPYVFEFDRAELNLYHDVLGNGTDMDLVGLGTGVVPTSGPNLWGMNSGPLVPNQPNTYGSIANVWDMWNLDEYYTYETGHNQWNQLTSLVDSLDQPVTFDTPITFSYTHSQANDLNDDPAYDGKTVLLTYEGSHTLWGIPSEGVDLNGDGFEDRWYPLFSLKDGIVIGPNGDEYVVKGVEKELVMKVDPAVPSLSLAGAENLTLPNGNNYRDPGTVAQPRVTDPPAVIEGVVQ